MTARSAAKDSLGAAVDLAGALGDAPAAAVTVAAQAAYSEAFTVAAIVGAAVALIAGGMAFTLRRLRVGAVL